MLRLKAYTFSNNDSNYIHQQDVSSIIVQVLSLKTSGQIWQLYYVVWNFVTMILSQIIVKHVVCLFKTFELLYEVN